MIGIGIVFAALIAALGLAASSPFLLVAGLLSVGVLLLVFLLQRIDAGASSEAQRLAQRRRQQDALAEMDRLSIDEFAARIAEALRRENNQVQIDADGLDARILHITNRAGTSILAMVKKTTTHVDLAEVQRLHGLATQQGAKVAYLFTNEGFTPEARQFAAGKPIHLADESALDRFASQVGIRWK